MTKIMAILNATPDSFFEKSRCSTYMDAYDRAFLLCQQGADVIDIGGESTRPGSSYVEEAVEIERVIPVLKALKGKLSAQLSIDTNKPLVALKAVEAGATLLNDITGFRQPQMQEIAAASGVDVCVMHMQGEPRRMQQNPCYPEGVVDHIMRWFENQVQALTSKGVKPEKIILDPGIGFGKTTAHNIEIIQNIAKFKTLGFRLLVGVSRKLFIANTLGKTATELLPATLAVNTLLIHAGVDIIRVHDVLEHRDIIKMLAAFKQSAL